MGKSRFAEVEAAVGETVDVAIKEKVAAYLFTGDLCDPDSGISVIQSIGLAIEAAVTLYTNKIPSIWIPGNHCVVEDGSGNTVLSPLASLAKKLGGHIWVCERPVLVQSLLFAYDFLALPYTASSHSYSPEAEVIKHLHNGNKNRAIVMGHLMIEGIQPGEETNEMPRGRDVMWPKKAIDALGDRVVFKVNGHYHRRQVFEGIYIPGSIARFTFGERENVPSYLLVDV